MLYSFLEVDLRISASSEIRSKSIKEAGFSTYGPIFPDFFRPSGGNKTGNLKFAVELL